MGTPGAPLPTLGFECPRALVWAQPSPCQPNEAAGGKEAGALTLLGQGSGFTLLHLRLRAGRWGSMWYSQPRELKASNRMSAPASSRMAGVGQRDSCHSFPPTGGRSSQPDPQPGRRVTNTSIHHRLQERGSGPDPRVCFSNNLPRWEACANSWPRGGLDRCPSHPAVAREPPPSN